MTGTFLVGDLVRHKTRTDLQNCRIVSIRNAPMSGKTFLQIRDLNSDFVYDFYAEDCEGYTDKIPKFRVGGLVQHNTDDTLFACTVTEIHWTKSGFQYWVVKNSAINQSGRIIYRDYEHAWNGPKFKVGDRVRHKTAPEWADCLVYQVYAIPQKWFIHVDPQNGEPIRDGGFESRWELYESAPETAEEPGVAAPPPPSKPVIRALSQPAMNREQILLGDKKAMALQARLLLDLQDRAMACRGCGHIFQPGEEKRSIQKSLDRSRTTALCAHMCWPEKLRRS